MQIAAYPYHPGYKDQQTSKEAAHKYAGKSKMLCDEIEAILKSGAMSAYDLARLFNEPITSIRPRLTQLKNQGKIEDSGERHLTEGGCREKVWRLVQTKFQYDSAGQGVMFA